MPLMMAAPIVDQETYDYKAWLRREGRIAAALPHCDLSTDVRAPRDPVQHIRAADHDRAPMRNTVMRHVNGEQAAADDYRENPKRQRGRGRTEHKRLGIVPPQYRPRIRYGQHQRQH